MPETFEQNPVRVNQQPSLQRRRWLALSIIVLGLSGFLLINAPESRVAALPAETQEASGGDFSKFSHSQTHAALPCLLCHRRENNSPRPNLPGHLPCSGCHTQRFSDSRSPICTVCHTDVQS